ncbi:MAG: TolC family protein [Deltaproteobacteria bacterium]|nr:TolC family protein [Deltaproteobacteria bacterium]
MKKKAWYRTVELIILIFLFGLFSGCAPDRFSFFTSAPPPQAVKPVSEEIQINGSGEQQNWQKSTLAADEPLVLSLEEAIVLTLRNNRDLQVQQLQPVITGAFEKIERGVFDPELFVEGANLKEESFETSSTSGTSYRLDSKEYAVIGGLRQRFPSGTDIEASIEQSREDSNREPEQQVARLGLTLTQALLRGFGPAVNMVGVRQAELKTLASENQLRGFTEALLAETEIAYWNYVLAEKEIAIFEESLAVARKQHDEIASRIEVGILPEIEIAAARAEIGRREQALIEARSVFSERRLRLLRLLNTGPFGRLERPVVATSQADIEAKPLNDLDDRIRLACQFRPDLQEADLLLQQNRLETIVTRNGLLPRLDFFIALGKTGYADSFSDSFRQLDGNTYDFTVGVRLSHFLGNRSAQGQDLAARASTRQAAEALANLRQVVELDVRLGANDVERNRRQIAASRLTRIYEEETLNAEQERFDVGSSTALQVAQAQRDLLASRIAEVQAVINYRIALVKLYLAEGSLLQRRGIKIAPFTAQKTGFFPAGNPGGHQ